MNAVGIGINWRGALAGLAIFGLIWLGCFFLAFMTAFGNPDPLSLAVLEILGIFFVVANPLWSIPVALLLGAVFIRLD